MSRAAATAFFILACACSHPEPRTVIAEPPPKPALVVGSKAPAFSLASLTTSGQAKLVPGKVMVVFFWATWNGPCKHAFPKLQALYAQYAPRGLEIAALSVDDGPADVREAATSWGAKFPVAWDRDHAIASEWRPSLMPTLYLIDRSGIIRHVQGAWHDGQEKDLEAEAAALL